MRNVPPEPEENPEQLFSKPWRMHDDRLLAIARVLPPASSLRNANTRRIIAA
jgi:hypothetical protein